MPMRDMRGFRNAQVRSRASGRQGRIENISAPWVGIDWFVPNQGLERQCVLRTDPILDEELEILTMDQGWVPLANVVGSKRMAQERRAHAEQVTHHHTSVYAEMVNQIAGRNIVEAEGGNHNPWHISDKNHWRKNAKERGATSGVTDTPRKDNEKKLWKCKRTGDYQQKCVGVGANAGKEKDVEIDKAKKAIYNAKYYDKWYGPKNKKAKKKGAAAAAAGD